MKRNFRFYLALYVTKITYRAMRLMGRNATTIPGILASTICPDFLGRIPLPKKIVGITGTNGKTTVSNMIEDVLDDYGYRYTCNRQGSNTWTGLISALVSDSTFFGHPKNEELAVFEMDERSAPLMLPYLKPDVMLCTNLFRDSYKRNAHTEFISSLLQEYIPDSTKMILNGDDIITSSLKPQNERLFFGIEKQEGESEAMKNIVCDQRTCPDCGETLDWDFVRYHHIGRAHCPRCGFQSADLDYAITSIDREKNQFTLLFGGQDYIFPIINGNLINIYNSLAAITMLLELGLTPQQIADSMKKVKVTESRYAEEIVGDKHIVSHLAKGWNPIACSRAFENAKDYPGRKSVYVYLDDVHDAATSVENISWLYDTDFEFLSDESITQVMVAGARHRDLLVRLLLAGVPKEKITHCVLPEEAIEAYRPDMSDCLFIVYDLYNLEVAGQIKARGKEIIAGKEATA